MKNRTPAPRDRSPADFTPVPRKTLRHDGWTPERQKAFIEALADTGSVATACRMVNMASEGAYSLRRQPGAESFRRAWEAALDFGVQRLKDEAFERAMNGQLVPVFAGGKLMGFRRKKNDRLLMFCLRHYGQDASGRRVTINYFSSRVTAGASGGNPQRRDESAAPNPSRHGEEDRAQRGGGALAPPPSAGEGLGRGDSYPLAPALASTTSVRTTISAAAPAGPEADDRNAALLEAFEGIHLDDQAQAEILHALEAAARRSRELPPEDDPEVAYLGADDAGVPLCLGELETGARIDDFPRYREGELSWQGMGEGGENEKIERVLAEMEARREEELAQAPVSPPSEEDPPVTGGPSEPEAARNRAAKLPPSPTGSASRRPLFDPQDE